MGFYYIIVIIGCMDAKHHRTLSVNKILTAKQIPPYVPNRWWTKPKAGARCITNAPQPNFKSRTPARPAAGVALHARAVAHQRVVAAFAAAIALIALHSGLGARVHTHHARGYRRAGSA